jgi:hypothetical protein
MNLARRSGIPREQLCRMHQHSDLKWRAVFGTKLQLDILLPHGISVRELPNIADPAEQGRICNFERRK